MTVVSGSGPLELLVIQPTPFCNIDCSYCYLPDRRNTRKITLETLEQTFAWAFRSGLVRQPFTLLWHAGEPMVLPASFYEQATVPWSDATICFAVTQMFQTNATLLDDAWRRRAATLMSASAWTVPQPNTIAIAARAGAGHVRARPRAWAAARSWH